MDVDNNSIPETFLTDEAVADQTGLNNFAPRTQTWDMLIYQYLVSENRKLGELLQYIVQSETFETFCDHFYLLRPFYF